MAKWYCLIDGKQLGPFEPAKLRQLADAGTLSPRHKVRREDMAQWHEASEVKGLFQLARAHAVPTHGAEGATKLRPTTQQSRTQEIASDDISSDTVALRYRQQPQSSDNPVSTSREKEEPEGMGRATKVVLAICLAIALPVFGVFVWFVAFRDPWEAINSEAVTAQLDKADLLQQTDVNAAYKIYDDVLNETKHHKLKNEEFITRLAHAEKSRETVYEIIQAKARAEEAERKRQAYEQARAEEEAEKKRQADAQARREAAEKERLAQEERTTVRTGDDARLATSGGSQVFVCVTESALSRFTVLAVAKDYLGMAGMEGAGQVFPVPSGTKVKVIDRGVFKSEVRVMEGQHIGDSGFVPSEFVTK